MCSPASTGGYRAGRAVLWQVDRWLIHDRAASTLHLVGIEGDEWTNEMSSFLDSKPELILKKLDPVIAVEDEVSSHTDQQHAEIVRRVQSAITSGQLYQLNFGRTWGGELSQSPWELMRRLARDNPAPFSAWLHCQDLGLALCSSSPELLLSSDSGVLITRPIKGTRPRGENPSAEAELRLELLSDEKELAEHTMLVDLGRNDIGKVCDYGTVHVNKLMEVKKFSHVQHMVTHVIGKLNKNYDMYDAFKAVFPAGTVSGAPKVRAMEIIDELEPESRGPYAGAVGYFSFNGCCDFAIAIRSIFADNEGGFVQAGAGIVFDSIPDNELKETEHKANAMITALMEASK